MLDAYRAERRKLLAQLSTRVLALVCALGPLLFAAVLALQTGVPADTLLGVWVHSSGYALSFVVLGFGGYLGFPVLAGVLAGDLFASEDRYGTWKNILTRSRSRWEVFWGKLLAAGLLALCLLALTGVSSLIAGLLLSGAQPLVGLSGNLIGSGECLWLLGASWLLSAPPLLAFVALAALLSAITRSGIVGVLGPVLAALAMALLELVGSGSWVHTLLLDSAFGDWHGLLGAPQFYGPMLLSLAVCAFWLIGSLGWAWLSLRRRDFAGVPVIRRPGWVVPLRLALGGALLLLALGAGTSLGPASVTQARLEGSISRAFVRLTVLQQRELGRTIPRDAKLELHTICLRHSGASRGPGDDWTCTLTVITPLPGAEPFLTSGVTYDVSAKADGCYKADAPPSFIGQQMMSAPHGRSLVNPLFTIYGCFDTTATVGCAESTECLKSAPAPTQGGRAEAHPAGPASAAEREALRRAEQEAGPAVMQEVQAAERREQRETERPPGEAEAPVRTR